MSNGNGEIVAALKKIERQQKVMRKEMNEGFEAMRKEMNEGFEKLDGRMVSLEASMDGMKEAWDVFLKEAAGE